MLNDVPELATSTKRQITCIKDTLNFLPVTTLRLRALLEKLPVARPLNKFSTLYITQRFITVFTKAHYWTLS
jgi:hypothetical protein